MMYPKEALNLFPSNEICFSDRLASFPTDNCTSVLRNSFGERRAILFSLNSLKKGAMSFFVSPLSCSVMMAISVLVLTLSLSAWMSFP